MQDPVIAFAIPRTIAQELVRVVADQIVRGELAPGTRLVEERLAEQFGVSRLPVREALRGLEADGLVSIAARRGATVRESSAQEIADLYACRVALQGMASRLAAGHMSPEGLKELESIVRAMGIAVDEDRFDDYFALNVQFHDTVARESGNRVLGELLTRLGRRVLRMRYSSLSQPGRLRYSLSAHRKLVAAFMTKDGNRAEAVTRDLIATAGEIMLAPHRHMAKPAAGEMAAS